MITPLAVFISDIHFNNNTLELAAAALLQAIQYAEDLNLPLIIAGDMHDTKAMLRGECVNRILSILRGRNIKIYVLIGNHDLLNEKASDHSLHFLDDIVRVIDTPTYIEELNIDFIPYQNNSDEVRNALQHVTDGSIIVMHQGLMGAHMGEYTVDKTSLPPEVFADFRVISGHYHKAQDIKCGRPRKGAVGLFSYIGTPYTITFAEANDGPKGFRVLSTDGILDLVPTNLRKHVVTEVEFDAVMEPIKDLNPSDLLWMKVHGPATELEKLNKKAIGLKHLGHTNFKLDKIYTDVVREVADTTLTDAEVFDRMIDNSDETAHNKTEFKALWRTLIT